MNNNYRYNNYDQQNQDKQQNQNQNYYSLNNNQVNPQNTIPYYSGTPYSTNNMSQINSPYTINKDQYQNNTNPQFAYSQFYNNIMIQNYYTMLKSNNNYNPVYNTNYNFNNVAQIPQNYANQSQHNYNIPYTYNNTQPNPYYQKNYKPYNNQNRNFRNNLNNFNDSEFENYKVKESKPVSAQEAQDIKLWIESRKKNFPSQNKKEEKKEASEYKKNVGLVSDLERKLREKIKVMSFLDKGGNRMRGRNNNQRRSDNKRRRNKRKKFKKVDEQPEEGEIVENNDEPGQIVENTIDMNENHTNKSSPKKQSNNNQENKTKNKAGFRYRKSHIYENLIRSDKFKEMNIILQAFRYFINEKLVD